LLWPTATLPNNDHNVGNRHANVESYRESSTSCAPTPARSAIHARAPAREHPIPKVICSSEAKTAIIGDHCHVAEGPMLCENIGASTASATFGYILEMKIKFMSLVCKKSNK
jgi:hypothetical protein